MTYESVNWKKVNMFPSQNCGSHAGIHDDRNVCMREIHDNRNVCMREDSVVQNISETKVIFNLVLICSLLRNFFFVRLQQPMQGTLIGLVDAFLGF